MSYIKFRKNSIADRNRIPGAAHAIESEDGTIVDIDGWIADVGDLSGYPDNAIILYTTMTRAYGCEVKRLSGNIHIAYPVQERASIAWVKDKGIYSHVWCKETEMQPYFRLKDFITSELKDALKAA